MEKQATIEELAAELAAARGSGEAEKVFAELVEALRSLPALPDDLRISEEGIPEIRLGTRNDPFNDDLVVDLEKGIWITNYPFPGHRLLDEEPEYYDSSPQAFLVELLGAYSRDLRDLRHRVGQLRAVKSGLPA